MVIAENKLETSLEKASKNPSARPQFYRDFCDCHVFAILESELPKGDITLPAGTALSLQAAEYNGKNYITAFTSLAHLAAFAKKDERYISMKGIELFRMIKKLEVLLNPGAPYGKEFTRKEIDAMLEGSMFAKNSGDTQAKKSGGFFQKLFGRK